MENPTNDSIELAVAFLKESGQRLSDVSPKGMTGLSILNQILSAVIVTTHLQLIPIVGILQISHDRIAEITSSNYKLSSCIDVILLCIFRPSLQIMICVMC